MLVVKPWIVVESFPGATCQLLCGVPAFSFSRTIGFGLVGAAAARAVAVVVAVTDGAAVEPVVRVFALPLVFLSPLVLPFSSWAFPFWSILMLLWMTACGVPPGPGITSSKSICEFCAAPLGNV